MPIPYTINVVMCLRIGAMSLKIGGDGIKL